MSRALDRGADASVTLGSPGRGPVEPGRALPRVQALMWGLLAAAAGLTIGVLVNVSLPAAVVLALGAASAAVFGTHPALAVAALPVLIFCEGYVPSGLIVPIMLLAAGSMAFGWTRIPRAAPLAWAAAFAVLAYTSSLWTDDITAIDQPTQYQGLALALCFMLSLAALLRSERDLRRFAASFVVVAVATGLAGIASVATGATERAEGFAGDPNIFAMYQVMALPLALALAATTKRAWTRAAGYLSALVIVGAVLASLSRGGLIALGLVLMLLMAPRTRTMYRSRVHKLGVVVAVLAAASLGLATLSSGITGRFSDEETAAGSGRINEWRASLQAIEQRPLVGLGFGGFYAASNELLRSTPSVDLRGFKLVDPGVRVHNAYLEAGAELGIPGLTLFLGLLLSTGRAFTRARRRAMAHRLGFTASMSTALLIGLAGFAVASVFLSTEASLALWSFVGVAVALKRPLEPQPQ